MGDLNGHVGQRTEGYEQVMESGNTISAIATA